MVIRCVIRGCVLGGGERGCIERVYRENASRGCVETSVY